MEVFELKAILGLDTSQYDKGLHGAESKAKGFGGKLKSGLGKAAKVGAATVAAVGTAVAGAGVAITKSAGAVAEYGDNIDKMSQKMGMSAKAYQEWDAILQHSGSSIESLKPSMKTLANAAQSGAEEFQKLGISQEEVANLSQEDLFAKTIEGLQNMEEGTERTAIASKLLGRGATELGALLNTSAEDTEKMRRRVNELGGVMSDEAVKASAAYQDSLQDLTTAMDGVKRNAIANFLPSMVEVMDGLTSIFAGENGGADKIESGISHLIEKVTTTAPKMFGKLKEVGKGLFNAIIENMPDIAKSLVSFAYSSIKGLTGLIPTLAKAAVNILSSVLKMAMDAVPKLFDGVSGTLAEGFGTVLKAVPQLLGSIAMAIAQGLPKIVEAGLKMLRDFAQSLAKNSGDLSNAGGGIIGSLITGIVETIPILVQYAPQIILALVVAIVKMLPAVIKAGGRIVLSLIKGIAKFVPNIAKGIVKGARDAIKKVLSLDWLSVGVNIVKGIASGIINSGGLIINAAVNAAKNAFEKAKEFLGINSPSKLFRDVIGRGIAEGMAVGVEDNEPLVTRAVSNLDRQIVEPYTEPDFIDYENPMAYDEVETITRSMDMPTVPVVGKQEEAQDITVILELDRMQLAKTVFKLNKQETQRMGVRLSGGYA